MSNRQDIFSGYAHTCVCGGTGWEEITDKMGNVIGRVRCKHCSEFDDIGGMPLADLGSYMDEQYVDDKD